MGIPAGLENEIVSTSPFNEGKRTLPHPNSGPGPSGFLPFANTKRNEFI